MVCAGVGAVCEKQQSLRLQGTFPLYTGLHIIYGFPGMKSSGILPYVTAAMVVHLLPMRYFDYVLLSML